MIIDAIGSSPILPPTVEGLAKGIGIDSDGTHRKKEGKTGESGDEKFFDDHDFRILEGVAGKGIPAPGAEVIVIDNVGKRAVFQPGSDDEIIVVEVHIHPTVE